ncbi:MAG: VOC family protein [Pyrinomonadaceae bacterium]|nr:VOC family protein [Pyrinomonadaceae bacterium]
MSIRQKIKPCLWFDDQAEDAANFYVSVFKNSSVGKVSLYTNEGFEIHGKKAGSVMTVEFTLDGQPFTALNGGPLFEFNEAISLQVICETQEEIDYFWENFTEEGEEVQCGWVKDKFGLSWQIVPAVLSDLTSDPQRSERVMKALLKMKKLDIEALKNA